MAANCATASWNSCRKTTKARSWSVSLKHKMSSIPANLKRPHMSLSTKLAACLDMLGLTGKTIQWDHSPSLGLRIFDGTKYTPDANDPKFIRPLIVDDHHVKTNGTHVPLSGDKSKIAKLKRNEEKEAAFRAKILAKKTGEPRPKRSRIPSRPFQQRKKQ